MDTTDKLSPCQPHSADTHLEDIWYLYPDERIATSGSSDEASIGTFSASGSVNKLQEEPENHEIDSTPSFIFAQAEESNCYETIEEFYPSMEYNLEQGNKERAAEVGLQREEDSLPPLYASENLDDQLQNLDEELNLSALNNLNLYSGTVPREAATSEATNDPAHVEQMVQERTQELPEHFVVLQYNGKRGPTTGTDVWRDSARGVRSLSYREKDIPNKKQDLCDKLKQLPQETRIDVNANDVEFVVPIKFEECVDFLQQSETNKAYKRLDSKSRTRYYKVAHASIILKDLWGRQKKKQTPLSEIPKDGDAPSSNAVARNFFSKEEEDLNTWIGGDEAKANASQTYKQQIELQRAILSTADKLDSTTRSEIERLCKATLEKSWEAVEKLYHHESSATQKPQQSSGTDEPATEMVTNDLNSMQGQPNERDVELGAQPASAVRNRKRKRLFRNLAVSTVVLTVCATILPIVFTTRNSQDDSSRNRPLDGPPLIEPTLSPTVFETEAPSEPVTRSATALPGQKSRTESQSQRMTLTPTLSPTVFESENPTAIPSEPFAGSAATVPQHESLPESEIQRMNLTHVDEEVLEEPTPSPSVPASPVGARASFYQSFSYEYGSYDLSMSGQHYPSAFSSEDLELLSTFEETLPKQVHSKRRSLMRHRVSSVHIAQDEEYSSPSKRSRA